ncbi:hypothetical protein NYO98_06155 [Nocardioides sp. STR2]|uniref:Uncharacterized protein n=1 Tax=Nocardioides pini TaxID=2975053 RepID=A0ABT4CA61_9ACTN|nr:hypothetical protein [Nocardioides pini]MCY4725857.1 hypothetical protein [Nocardioides pini]
MEDVPGTRLGGDGRSAGRTAWRLAALSLMVLALGAVLFATAWVVGGDDAVSDNWVGATVVLALFAGLFCSLVAMVTALYAGIRREPWSTLWLPLTTFPAVVAVVALLEAFVSE